MEGYFPSAHALAFTVAREQFTLELPSHPLQLLSSLSILVTTRQSFQLSCISIELCLGWVHFSFLCLRFTLIPQSEESCLSSILERSY